MNQRWEIKRVSTPERIFDKISQEMPQPVGIVLFGADCDFKNDVYMQCVERIPYLATGYGGKTGNIALRGAKQPFSEGRSVLTIMGGESSGNRDARHQTVIALRDLGAKSVVGIYAKRHLPALRIADNAAHLKNSCSIEQAEILERNPPTADGLDYLIVVEEEKEG